MFNLEKEIVSWDGWIFWKSLSKNIFITIITIIIIIIISIIILVIIVTVIIFMNILTRPIQIFTDWHYPLMKSLRALRSKRSLKNSISGAIHIYLECSILILIWTPNLIAGRVKLIVGLPRNLTSFRIICNEHHKQRSCKSFWDRVKCSRISA